MVPSLDTPVCNKQTKRFADELKALGEKVAAYTVSLDLPFAQARFCTDANIENLKNLSDAHDHSFGEHYGVGLMFDDPKNLRLYEACDKVRLPVMFHIDFNIHTAWEDSDIVLGKGGFGEVKEICFPFWQLPSDIFPGVEFPVAGPMAVKKVLAEKVIVDLSLCKGKF